MQFLLLFRYPSIPRSARCLNTHMASFERKYSVNWHCLAKTANIVNKMPNIFLAKAIDKRVIWGIIKA